MSDVIIAIVPAEGHEGLTADGPMGERPALLLRDLGEWLTVDRAAHAPHLYNDCDVALVLHAPGDPKLGMVRAMEAAGAVGNAAFIGARFGYWGGLVPAVYLDRSHNAGSVELNLEPPRPLRLAPYLFPFAVAHLLLQRGIAREVLVLP